MSANRINGNGAPRTRKPKSSGDRKSEDVCDPASILVIDVGGTKLKVLVSGHHEPRKIATGKRFTPIRMVEAVKKLTADWEYDAISIGVPGLVGDHGPRSEPGNLGAGWVGFPFAAAFGKPVRIINDAAMQALGSYEGGKMLFLGLGTGVGSALISEKVIIPMELGGLSYHDGRTLFDVLGKKALAFAGKVVWRQAVADVVKMLLAAMVADYVVIGGGSAKHVKVLPPGARLGHNLTAFRGGFRLWNVEDVPTLSAEGTALPCAPREPGEWRYL